jgi:hypothetical protein
MEGAACFENYPMRIVAVANALNFSIWIIGIFVLSGFGVIVATLYLAYCLVMEFNILRRSCVNCYYYGKVCFSGLGKVRALLFERNEGGSPSEVKITWRDIMPDMMASIFPIAGGIILLATSFSWPILISIIVLVLLTTVGNGFVRGSLACRYCRQRELGCPAQKLFKGEGQDHR